MSINETNYGNKHGLSYYQVEAVLCPQRFYCHMLEAVLCPRRFFYASKNSKRKRKTDSNLKFIFIFLSARFPIREIALPQLSPSIQICSGGKFCRGLFVCRFINEIYVSDFFEFQLILIPGYGIASLFFLSSQSSLSCMLHQTIVKRRYFGNSFSFQHLLLLLFFFFQKVENSKFKTGLETSWQNFEKIQMLSKK